MPSKKPHLRLTAEEVRDLWRGEYLKAPGYLLMLLLALKREGWENLIDDPEGDRRLTPVQRFCAKWEISERSFQRAKAKLILDGRIAEKALGYVVLQVIPRGQNQSQAANSGGMTANSGGETANSGGIATLKPPPEGESSNRTDLFSSNQLLSSLSQIEREEFLNFCREQVENFDPPIVSIQDYLANKERWRDFWPRFQSERERVAAAAFDWRSHPQFAQALAAMRDGLPAFRAIGHPDLDLDRETRLAMADFAEAHNLIWGDES